MKAAITTILTFTIVLFSMSNFVYADSVASQDYGKGTVIVTLKKGYDKDVINTIAESIQAKNVKRTLKRYKDNEESWMEKAIGGTMWTVEFPVEKDVFEVIALLEKNEAVKSASPNYNVFTRSNSQ